MKQKFEQIPDETDLDGERAAVLGYHRGSQGLWRLLFNYFNSHFWKYLFPSTYNGK